MKKPATTAKTANQEKSTAALNSVFAAVGLTLFKIIIGIATGSLGILAEAAHSALDLVAAFVTFLAVRLSGKPADPEHLYGHGKIENLSALFETLLLLGTCVYIIYQASQRLFVKPVEVEVTIWAFIVMLASVVVNFVNSRALYAAARKHRSQALEADALHFNTDIWSSSVVILGLFLVKVGDWLPSLHILRQSDAVAALGVALIVIYVSIELGMRTVKGLLDTAPAGSVEKITAAVEALPGVSNAHDVRVRVSGAQTFIDAHVLLDGSQSLEQAHAMTEVIEKTIHGIIPHSDVVVHPEPIKGLSDAATADLVEKIKAAIEALPGVSNCHRVRVHVSGAQTFIDAHVLLDGSQTLEQAHALTEVIEKTIHAIIPHSDITVHPEPIDIDPRSRS